MCLSFEGGAAKSNKSLDGERQQMNFHRIEVFSLLHLPAAVNPDEFQRSSITSRDVRVTKSK